MSATSHPVLVASAETTSPVGFGALVRSEWIKLTSLRSTIVTLGVVGVLSVGFGVMSAASVNSSWGTMSPGDRALFDATKLSFYGIYLAQLAVGVLGALSICGEYATGSMRTTLLVTPNRRRVLAAKAGVFAAVTFVVGEVVAFASFGVTQALIQSPVPRASLTDPNVLTAVALCGAYLPLVGLLALGLGAIIRSTAGTIAAFIGVVLVVGALLVPLPTTWQEALLPLTPGRILTTFMAPVAPPPHSLDPWVALAVLVGEVALVTAIGAMAFQRRDA